ncbi:MlaD family protein [candidate division CSSED10-310 bacterium]|uniref:MlaD family protein n=1 Tax=candidate division CSSED10-310 bacterium TaxID=2855610 RepID=A0ABV6Z672_UNCC1
MEETQKKQILTNIRVGFFFLLIISIIMVILFLVKSKTDLLEPQYEFTINFPQIQGLKLGAAVQLAGVRIGEVNKIKFPEDLNMTSVLVTVKVKKSAMSRIRQNGAIYIDSPSLLSEKNIQITFGTEDSPIVKDGDVLDGLPAKP